MECPQCRTGVRETARFCESCGSVLKPEDPAYRLSHAQRLETTGDLAGALREYEQLLDADGMAGETAAIHKHLGNLHFRLGHLRGARGHLAKACVLEPQNPAFWHDKGIIEYHMAEFDDAVESLKEALRRDPELHLAYFWLGSALYHRGNMDEAAASFRELLEQFPNFAVARFHLGVIYERQGRKGDAHREFRRVLFQNPEDAAARFYVSGRGAGGSTP